ncbi:hypothetical protein KCU87_g257, partial [Aureobasidium melanogenum]
MLSTRLLDIGVQDQAVARTWDLSLTYCEILLCPRLSDQASQWESDKRSVVVSRGEVGNDTPTTRQEAPRRSFRIWQPWDLDVSSSVLIRTIER